MTGNYLVTTDNWFYAPDGKKYRAVYGNVEIVEDSFLGIKTNRQSTNWYAKIGTEQNHVIVAGCQIQYTVKCEKENISFGKVEESSYAGGQPSLQITRDCEIYDASSEFIQVINKSELS